MSDESIVVPADGAEPAPEAPAADSQPRPARSVLGRTFSSLANRDVRYLTISSTGMGFGMWGQQIAQGWLVYVLTGSAAQLGGVAFVSGLLALVFTPVGGLLADRYSRRSVIMLSTVAGSVQAVAIALLVITGVVQVWHVYVFSVLNAVTTALNQPARQAFVFDVSAGESLSNAIAMNSIAQNVSRIVGPPLAGALTAVSLSSPFIFVAVVRLIATVTTAMIGTGRGRRERPARHPLAELADGFRYVGREPQLLGLIAVVLLPSLLVFPYLSFMPLFASKVLHAGSFGYGLLLMMGGFGAITGLLLLAYHDVERRGLVMLVTYTGYVAFVALFTQSTSFVLSLFSCMLANVCLGSASALNTTIFQLHVRSDMRGRGMGVWQMASGIAPLGALPMGFAVARLGPANGVVVFDAACFVLLAFAALRWRSLRSL